MSGLYDIANNEADMGLQLVEQMARQNAQRNIANKEVREENLGSLIGAGMQAGQMYDNQKYLDSLKPKTTTIPSESPPVTAPSTPVQTPSMAPHDGPASTGPFAHLDPFTQGAIYNAINSIRFPQPGVSDQVSQ
jgi:hypothetical protein